MNKFAMSVAVAAMLASPLLARADASSTGTLSNFSYTLIDLRPDDGIAPSLTRVPLAIDSNRVRAYGYSSDNGSVEPLYHDVREQRTTPYDRDLHVDLATPAGTTSASVTGTDFTSLAFSTAAATASAPGANRRAQADTIMTLVDFVLSPGTQVSFSADFSASASTTFALGPGFGDYAATDASIGVNVDVPVGIDGYDNIYSTVNVPNWTAGETGPGAVSASRHLALVLDNASAYAARLTLNIRLVSVAESAMPASPVPEPATTAMLAAGLALVAGVARRRAAQGA